MLCLDKPTTVAGSEGTWTTHHHSSTSYPLLKLSTLKEMHPSHVQAFHSGEECPLDRGPEPMNPSPLESLLKTCCFASYKDWHKAWYFFRKDLGRPQSGITLQWPPHFQRWMHRNQLCGYPRERPENYPRMKQWHSRLCVHGRDTHHRHRSFRRSLMLSGVRIHHEDTLISREQKPSG